MSVLYYTKEQQPMFCIVSSPPVHLSPSALRSGEHLIFQSRTAAHGGFLWTNLQCTMNFLLLGSLLSEYAAVLRKKGGILTTACVPGLPLPTESAQRWPYWEPYCCWSAPL